MKKFRRTIIIFAILIKIINPISSKAITITTVTKEFLNFEILNATIDSDKITISGWAFINDSQHYKNTADHSIKFRICKSKSFICGRCTTY